MASDCPSCGRTNEDDARFCSGCGAEIAPACASCGAKLTPGAAFCASCGAAAAGAATGTTEPMPPTEAPGATQPLDLAQAPAESPSEAPSAGAAPPGAQPPSTATGAGGPPRRRLSPTLLIVIVLLVAAAVAAAVVLLFVLPGDDKEPSGETTPTPTASVSESASPGPGSPFYLAAITGPRANTLSTVSADGTIRTISSDIGKDAYQVAWSQNGQRIACVAGTWKHRRLWVTDLRAGEILEAQIATPSVVCVDSVAWLNARELLVAGFTTVPKGQGEDAELLVYDVAMHDVEPLDDADGNALRGVMVSASQDGEKVAYVAYTDQTVDQYGMATATEGLELLDRGTGTVTHLGSGEAQFDVNARRFDEPLISPTGDAVIFRAAGSDVGTSYTVVDATGTTLMPAKELLFPAGYAWDPTGQKVVFTGHSPNWKGGSGDPTSFYLFDRTVGGAPKVIARYKDTAVQGLSWSPDGSTIAFAEWDQDNYTTGKIYQMSPSGGDADLLVRGALLPAFQPPVVASDWPEVSPSP